MLVINIGDTVITKKPHPCGQNSWTVIRTGADVKLKCNGCGRVVMLDRLQCEKKIKKLINKAEANNEL
ncbi:MAG: DUF951 domain-containing protein [Selenomonadales bacterium]|jgi:hypothetical protein|nr:MAG: DUF951 domain-containing protein [Selenomonadales bacterium]